MKSEAVEAVVQRGIPLDLAERWIATGAVDPDLRERLHYPAVQGKIRFRHWIQMKHLNNGFLRYTNRSGAFRDHPYLSQEEVEIWHRTGWVPNRRSRSSGMAVAAVGVALRPRRRPLRSTPPQAAPGGAV
jgi:hypothetical protein